eukprot:1784137-Pyramimonas_sp.AAC.1
MASITNQLAEYAELAHTDYDYDLRARTLLETARGRFGERGSHPDHEEVKKRRTVWHERRQFREHLAFQRQGHGEVQGYRERRIPGPESGDTQPCAPNTSCLSTRLCSSSQAFKLGARGIKKARTCR